ncbi:MAG: hypothetical protein KatS3mg032_0593 [Cyclobacteriaceae bacterium]|nr:MAG: hypothetical protein KatS3mg032_0593 [Cyclobacteriaceae bacterium]
MQYRHILILVLSFCGIILFSVNFNQPAGIFSQPKNNPAPHEEGVSGPEQFRLFHRGIRTRDGKDRPDYTPGFLVRELRKARIEAARKLSGARTLSGDVLEWRERGPANVPGRTRGLIVDPDDPAKNTWYAGSVAGGVWKTTNGGTSWTLITPDLPNLATTVLAMAPSNHNVIYLGTGEGFGNVDHVSGNGMYKSSDRGQTWQYLPATAGFSDVNRIIIDPASENTVLAATNRGIFRTTDGGTTWTQTSSRTNIQDLRHTPGNFNIQYAAQHDVGVLKSVDGGLTWTVANTGMNITGRVEIAISPVNPLRVFASAEGSLSATGSDLYMSDDGATTWSLVDVAFNNQGVDYLGGQGWYDNTIACDPFNENIVYIGGVSLFRVQITSGTTLTSSYSLQENGTENFMALVSFTGASHGNFQVGSSANGTSVEIRFGPGKMQKAHRFLVPEGATSGVPEANYSFTDYVDVPFEVWDISTNRQLMVSFRDQDRNGQFNLLPFNTSGPATEQSREYVYVHNLDYNNATPNASVAVNGGHVFNLMYNIWPRLADGKNWPGDVVESQLRFIHTSVPKRNATTVTSADVYGQYDGKNRFNEMGTDMHPDQHNIVMIPVNTNQYRMLVANDGGIFISNISATPGINQGDWTMVGRTYNTTQFYGADKRPGKDEYFGGTQDNGTWRSPANVTANAGTNYLFCIGGDGFEVLWHSTDGNKLIGGSQFNGFMRSTNGGVSWTGATTGLSGQAPFISKLAHNKFNPDVIYTVSSAGVFRSTNFGQSWTLTPITDKWGASTFLDVEVSQANANIVWAGSGMSATRNLHVSTDAGLTFTAVNNFTLVPMGTISRLASHPFEPNTAYALFSFADAPKVLRTRDLGQTWEDISGFGTGNESTNGFPDVAVYCLYVRPDNPDIIWVGSEIGIIESRDNGLTWALRTDFPAVSVWDMKGQDDQVVIATHGRGIWTARFEEPQMPHKRPRLVAAGTSVEEKLSLKIVLEEAFDSVRIFSGSVLYGALTNLSPGEITVSISGLLPGEKNIQLVGYKGSGPIYSENYQVTHLDILSTRDSYITYFNSINELTVNGMLLQQMPGGNTGERRNLQTTHNYAHNFEYSFIIRHPVRVASSNATLFYRDVAIVEPINDYVVVEATQNGLDWVELTPRYDAQFNPDWLAAFNAGQPGQKSMLTDHLINLLDYFSASEEILIRFRMKTNTSVNGWGWAVDVVSIQQTPTGVENNPVLESVNLYPNPANSRISISYGLRKTTTVSWQVINNRGQMQMRTPPVVRQAGSHTEMIDVSGLAPGMYVARGPDNTLIKFIISR